MGYLRSRLFLIRLDWRIKAGPQQLRIMEPRVFSRGYLAILLANRQGWRLVAPAFLPLKNTIWATGTSWRAWRGDLHSILPMKRDKLPLEETPVNDTLSVSVRCSSCGPPRQAHRNLTARDTSSGCGRRGAYEVEPTPPLRLCMIGPGLFLCCWDRIKTSRS